MPLEMVIHIGGVLKWLSFMLLLWPMVVAAARARRCLINQEPQAEGGWLRIVRNKNSSLSYQPEYAQGMKGAARMTK